MPSFSFDLVDTPWLPCVTHDGVGIEISLRQAVVQAHDYRELFDPSPLVTVALHRLLLAVLHRAYLGPPGIEEWRDIWHAGQFDPGLVNSYLDRWQHRFDLFDVERPFYQVPFIADLADPKQQAPIAKLAQEAAAGNNATLFDHSVDADPLPIPAATAARLVVAVQAFSIGLGKSFPFYLSDSTLIRGFSVLAAGATLFETLMLNLLAYNHDVPIPWLDEGDAACWERETPAAPVQEGSPLAGYCDLLTWQSRQIHCVPDDTGDTVSRCQLRQNRKVGGNALDPFKCYLRDEQKGFRPRSFRPQRALWRDSTLLFQQFDAQNQAASSRPALLDWLARIEAERVRKRIDARPVYRLRAYGLTTDDGKAASVVLWRREDLPLPLALLDTPRAIVPIRNALDAAEAAGRALNRGARELAELLLAPMSDDQGGRKPDADKAVKPLVRALGMEQRFWPRLEEPFARFLIALPDDQHPDPDDETEIDYGITSLPKWADAVRTAARDAFTEATASLDRSARSLKAVANARGTFERELSKALRLLAAAEAPEEDQGGAAA